MTPSTEPRIVPLYPGLGVTPDGQVWSRSTGQWRPRKTNQSPKGHLRLTVSIRGRKKGVWVHRLVARAFHGPPPFDGAEVCHVNGNPQDNRPSNLYWGTRSENARDREEHKANARINQEERAGLSGDHPPYVLDPKWGF